MQEDRIEKKKIFFYENIKYLKENDVYSNNNDTSHFGSRMNSSRWLPFFGLGIRGTLWHFIVEQVDDIFIQVCVQKGLCDWSFMVM